MVSFLQLDDAAIQPISGIKRDVTPPEGGRGRRATVSHTAIEALSVILPPE